MEQYRFLFGRTIVEVPWWWIDALLAWMGIIGLVLWLFGRHLIRPFFGIVGLVQGSMVGTFIALRFFPEQPPIPFVVGGAILGAIVAWTMFRFGMAAVLGFTVAMVAPIVLLSVQGVPAPRLGDSVRVGIEDILKATSVPESSTTDENGRTVLKSGEMPPPLAEPFNKAVDEFKARFDEWWAQVPPAVAGIAMVATVAGLAGGFVMGLFMPGLSAAFVAALLGTVLMLGGARRVAGGFIDAITPGIEHGSLILLGVVVVIGATMQMTIFRKSGG